MHRSRRHHRHIQISLAIRIALRPVHTYLLFNEQLSKPRACVQLRSLHHVPVTVRCDGVSACRCIYGGETTAHAVVAMALATTSYIQVVRVFMAFFILPCISP